MGAYARAAIIYGFPFTGEGCDACYEHELFEEDESKWLAHFQGLQEPEGDYKTNEEAWKYYRDDRRTLPITINDDGDMMSGMTTSYLLIRESEIRGDWDRGTKIPVGHIQPPPPRWDALLKEFCEKAGVAFVQPEWQLLASLG